MPMGTQLASGATMSKARLSGSSLCPQFWNANAIPTSLEPPAQQQMPPRVAAVSSQAHTNNAALEGSVSTKPQFGLQVFVVCFPHKIGAVGF